MVKVVEVDKLNAELAKLDAWITANQRDEGGSVVPPPNDNVQPVAPNAAGWHMAFRDEFDTLSLSNSITHDGKTWYSETEPSNMPGGTSQHRCWPHVIPPTTVEQSNPFSIVQGGGSGSGKVLRMTLKTVNGVWYGANIATVDRDNQIGFAQAPPAFWEARMKLPPGSGPWLSFWALSQARMGPPGVNGMYTQKGEVDILEYWGDSPAYWTNLHDWTKPKGQDGVGGNKAMARSDFYSAFHVYGMDWDNNRMLIYFDGEQVGNIATPNIMKSQSADQPNKYFPILTLGMGGGYAWEPTPNPSIMDVDYVRVWAK